MHVVITIFLEEHVGLEQLIINNAVNSGHPVPWNEVLAGCIVTAAAVSSRVVFLMLLLESHVQLEELLALLAVEQLHDLGEINELESEDKFKTCRV
jgi:hypothetical protein